MEHKLKQYTEEQRMKWMSIPWRPWQIRGLDFIQLMNAKGKRVIDVGCCHGWAALFLRDQGAIVHATDVVAPDHPQIKRLIQEGIPYTRYLGTVGKHDVIWFHHALEHIEAPIDFLVRLRDVGNELWVAVPRIGPFAGWAWDEINLYKMPVLIEHLRRGGWDVENCSYNTNHAVLQVVARKQDGWVRGKPNTYSKYPAPLLAMDNTNADYERPNVDKWNWEILQERGEK